MKSPSNHIFVSTAAKVPAKTSSTTPVTDVTPLLRNEYSSLRSTADEDTNVPIVHLNDLKSEPPSAKKWQIAATFYSFLIVGATDGAYGVRTLGCMPMYSNSC